MPMHLTRTTEQSLAIGLRLDTLWLESYLIAKHSVSISLERFTRAFRLGIRLQTAVQVWRFEFQIKFQIGFS